MSGASGFIATIEGLAEAPLERKGRCGASGFIATAWRAREGATRRPREFGASLATLRALTAPRAAHMLGA
jgi:hypothetical protein